MDSTYWIISTKEDTIMRPDGSWATRRTMKTQGRDGTVRTVVEEQVVGSSPWSGPMPARPLITDGEKTCKVTCKVKGCTSDIHADSPSYCHFHRCRARVTSTGKPCPNRAKDDSTRWCGTHYSKNHGKFCNASGCTSDIHADSPSYCDFHRCQARVASTGKPCPMEARDDSTRWCQQHYSSHHGKP